MNDGNIIEISINCGGTDDTESKFEAPLDSHRSFAPSDSQSRRTRVSGLIERVHGPDTARSFPNEQVQSANESSSPSNSNTASTLWYQGISARKIMGMVQKAGIHIQLLTATGQALHTRRMKITSAKIQVSVGSENNFLTRV